MITDMEKTRLEEMVAKLREGLEPDYDGNIYDLLCAAYHRYKDIIPEIADCYDEAYNFSGTTNRNLRIVSELIEDYIVKNSAIHTPFSMSLGHLTDVDLKELIENAENFYASGDKQSATEKIWDAFERMKTYYIGLNKRDSVNRIINNVGQGDNDYFQLFDGEFRKLTEIGNTYRIRHHETDKKNIDDERYYDYFYLKCISLISTTIQFL